MKTNPIKSEGSYRVIRGGSWLYSASYLRCVNRSGNTPVSTYYYLGLRLVRTKKDKQ